MYDDRANEETLGLGLYSMFTFANVLGSILILRWNKNGLGLIAVSVVLLSIVYAYVLHFRIVETIPFISAVIFLWLILQIRKGGKSAWSQLKSGWDSKHCRHIYQLFAVVELIMFILTLIAFGSNKGKQPSPEPVPILTDTIVAEKQNSDEDVSRDSIPVADSIKPEEPNISSSDEKANKDDSNKPKPSENKTSPEKNTKNSSSLEDAARYLDSHAVWRVAEMSHYHQISDLNSQIIRSLREGRNRIPASCPSSKLNTIRKLLIEIDRLSRDSDRDLVRKYMKYSGNQSEVRPDDVINSLRRALYHIRMYDTQRKTREKNRGIGGDESSDDKDARKKRIQKEMDDYTMMDSDSIKYVPPTFGLR